MSNDIYRCTPRQTKALAIQAIEAGLVPFIQSSPGIGKSSIMRAIARQFRLYLIDHRLSTSAPEDLSGLPEFYTDESGIRRARFVPFEMFPVEGTRVPDGYDGWMVFLDEANSGTKMVQAASYKLILDRMVGQYNLHERVAMGLAGNLSTDRAIVTTLSTAMQSRLVHIEMTHDFNEWLEDVALPEQYDERVIAFLNWKKDYLMDFRPDHQEKTFCCPRTWEFMHRLVQGREVTDEQTPLYAGTVTSGVAAEFVQFTKIFKEMTQIADVLRDPANAPVPAESQRKWAVISHLMGETTQQNFDKICTYVNKFDLAFRALYFRGVIHTQPALRQHSSFGKAMLDITKYLEG
jgi:hypothetical protein